MNNYNEKLKCLEEAWRITKRNHTEISNALKSKEGFLYELNNKSTLESNTILFAVISV